MKLKAIFDKLVVKVDSFEEKSKGGLYLAQNLDGKSTKQTGVVVSKGESPDIPAYIKENETRVIWAKGLEQIVDDDEEPGVKWALVSVFDVLAAVEK